MRETELKSPGSYGHGQRLRKEVANAISAAEISSGYAGEPSSTAIALADFLTDAASKTPGYVAPEPDPLPATQAVVSDGQTLAVTGGTVTLSVEDGVVTATYAVEE